MRYGVVVWDGSERGYVTVGVYPTLEEAELAMKVTEAQMGTKVVKIMEWEDSYTRKE